MEHRASPRALTLALPDAMQPYLVFRGSRYALRNLSEEGLALWMPKPAPAGWAVGMTIEAELIVNKEAFVVKLEIVHHQQAQRYVGVRLKHNSPKLKEIFHRLLEPAFYAAEMFPHKKWGTEDPLSNQFRAWYAGTPGTELIVWIREAQKVIMALQLCWQGKWVYRVQFQPPMTGFLKDEGVVLDGSMRKAADLLIRHRSPDPSLIQEAARFLTSLPRPIAGALLWQFLETGEQVFLPESMLSIRKAA